MVILTLMTVKVVNGQGQNRQHTFAHDTIMSYESEKKTFGQVICGSEK